MLSVKLGSGREVSNMFPPTACAEFLEFIMGRMCDFAFCDPEFDRSYLKYAVDAYDCVFVSL